MASLFVYKVFESLNTKCFGVTLYVARYYYIIVHSYGKRQQEPIFRCYAFVIILCQCLTLQQFRFY